MEKIVSYIFFAIFLFSNNVVAQKDYQLLVEIENDEHNYFKDDSLKLQFKSESFVHKYLENLVYKLIGEQYYLSSLDNLEKFDSLSYKAKLHLGPKFDHFVLEEIGIDSNLIRKVSDLNDLKDYQNQLLLRQQERGYPFSTVQLIDIDVANDTIFGTMVLESGKQIFLDTIKMYGDVQLRNNYLYKYLNLRKGEPFKLSDFVDLRRKLYELNFMELEKEPELSFFDRWASLHVYAKNRNASRFEFLFGINPTDQIEDQSLFISLDVAAEMYNKLGYGEYLFFEFQRLRPEQQSISIKARYPFVLDLPLAVDGAFRLFRNSDDYLNVDAEAGFEYLVGHKDYIKLLWSHSSSRLVALDTVLLLNTMKLPQDLDVSQNGLGIEAEYNQLDYNLNPRKGFRINSRIVGGTRNIQENQDIKSLSSEQVDFSSSYDSLDLQGFRLKWITALEYYVPLSLRGVLRLKSDFAWMYSSSDLARNELFQIGGLKTLRGFDEASFFTERYIIPTIEYRLVLTRNSYLSLPFIDFAFLENREGVLESGFGIGGGISFETSMGILNFSIAAGQIGNIDFNLGRPKVHFGFLSLF